MNAVLHGVDRDHVMAHHKANHMNVVHATDADTVDKALALSTVAMTQLIQRLPIFHPHRRVNDPSTAVQRMSLQATPVILCPSCVAKNTGNGDITRAKYASGGTKGHSLPSCRQLPPRAVLLTVSNRVTRASSHVTRASSHVTRASSHVTRDIESPPLGHPHQHQIPATA
jgi:hypothetical protein